MLLVSPVVDWDKVGVEGDVRGWVVALVLEHVGSWLTLSIYFASLEKRN